MLKKFLRMNNEGKDLVLELDHERTRKEKTNDSEMDNDQTMPRVCAGESIHLVWHCRKTEKRASRLGPLIP